MRQRTYLAPGQVFDNAKVIRFARMDAKGNQKYECECFLCGDIFVAYKDSLVRGITRSCPACAKGFNLFNQVNNGWRAERRDGRATNGEILWHCRCVTCGKHKTVRSSHFRKGLVLPCNHEGMKDNDDDDLFFRNRV